MSKMFSIDTYRHTLKSPFSRKKKKKKGKLPRKPRPNKKKNSSGNHKLQQHWALPRVPSDKRYQEVVPEEFRQLQTDDVIVKRKKVERPFVGGHIWKGSQGDTLVTCTTVLMDVQSCQTLLTSEHALLLQHRVARVELGRKGGGVSRDMSTASRTSHAAKGQHAPSGVWRWSCTGGALPLPCRHWPHLKPNKRGFYYFFWLDTTSFKIIFPEKFQTLNYFKWLWRENNAKQDLTKQSQPWASLRGNVVIN